MLCGVLQIVELLPLTAAACINDILDVAAEQIQCGIARVDGNAMPDLVTERGLWIQSGVPLDRIGELSKSGEADLAADREPTRAPTIEVDRNDALRIDFAMSAAASAAED